MKKTFTLITLITLLFALIGCNADSTPTTGSITVSINDAISRTITSSDSLEAVRYAVEGTGPNDTTVSFELSESSPTWTNSEAIAGSWNFTATAYNASDKAIGEGSSAATVAPGKNTSVSIEVNEYQGKGTLTITLTGISSDLGTCKAQIYKLGDEKGDLVVEEDITEGSASFELDNGYYFITLVCETDKIAMPAPEAVRIMKDDNLRADYTLNNPGGITANITNGINPCPEMSITLNSDNVQVGSSVTATATITPGTYKYSWYVDGERQTSANGNSVEIIFAWEGAHKVTCVAYDTKTTVIWSEEITVDVIPSQVNRVSFYSGDKLIDTRIYTPGKTETFPSIMLGDGFTLTGWKAEGSDTLITDKSFSLPYAENEYKFYAYIDTDLLRIDETGAVYGTDVLKNSSTITEVVIPDSIRGKAVTSIGKRAFYLYYQSLACITIPDSVTSIGEEAFCNCSSLTGITIPASVTFIGEYALCNCDNLTSINVSEDNKYFKSIDGVLFDKDQKTIIAYPNGHGSMYEIPDSVVSILDYAFSHCDRLTSITIPNSVTSIGSAAFCYCNSLTSVSIGNSVTSIGDAAFNNCSSLTYITIPDSVTSIGGNAFSYCSSLTSIIIPDSVTSIGEYAFSGCYKLTGISIGNSVISIGEHAFNACYGLTSITVSDNNNYFKSIDGVLFDKDEKTIIVHPSWHGSKYVIPDSVISIGDCAFLDCYSLTSITIPDSVTTIGHFSFEGCYSLTSITIPDSVTTIGDSTFYDCSSLKSITIPASVTSIGSSAFLSCSSLSEIRIDKPKGSVSGAPWGASSKAVKWRGEF